MTDRGPLVRIQARVSLVERGRAHPTLGAFRRFLSFSEGLLATGGYHDWLADGCGRFGILE